MTGFAKTEGAWILSLNKRQYTINSVAECAAKCNSETTFTCKYVKTHTLTTLVFLFLFFFLWLSSAPTVTYGERPLCDLTGPSCTWRRTRSVGRPQITQKQRRFCGEAAQPYTKKRASFLHRLWFGFDTVKIRDLDFILLHRVNVYHIQTNKQTTKCRTDINSTVVNPGTNMTLFCFFLLFFF